MSAHVLVRASAGAGKTFQLTNRFLRLLMQGVSVDAIMASTFSRKAAGEIIERVLTRLAVAAAADEGAAALASELGTGHDRRAFEQQLVRLCRRLHRLSIGTLDAFFMALGQGFGAELGFLPGWRVLDEAVEQALRRAAVARALNAQDRDDLFQLLVQQSRGEQRQSVVTRLEQLFNEVYPVHVTSSAEAWLEAPPLQPAPSLDEALSALRAVLVTNERFAAARDEDVARARLGAEAFLDKGLAKKLAAGDIEFHRKPIDDALQTAYAAVFAAFAADLRADLLAQTRATFHLVRGISDALFHAKAALGGYGFDDISRILAQRMHDGGPALDDVFFRLDRRVQHLLLDEFQDTSLQQWHVLQPLVHEITAHGGGERGFFCVGDVKQAIYGWRGGVREIFDALASEIPGLGEETLDKSYRSSPIVMQVVNQVFLALESNEALRDQPRAGEGWVFHAHQTAKLTLPGHARVIAAERADKDEKQDHVTLAAAASEAARLWREHPDKTIGVLVRRNQAVARLIHLLTQRGVQASEEGGNPLTDARSVTLLLSLLKIADHPGDRVRRFLVARSPIGAAVGLADWRDDGAAERLSQRVRARLLDVGIGRLLREHAVLLDASGRERARLEQLVELGERFERQTQSDAQLGLRLMRFVEFVEATRVEEPLASRMRVMTIHQAKGLEFDLVVCVDLDQQLLKDRRAILVDRPTPLDAPRRVTCSVPKKLRALLPELQPMADDADRRTLEEALCNLYVALTRARQGVYAIVAPSGESEQRVPKTLAGILRAGLAPGQRAEPGQVLFELGTPLGASDAPSDPPAPITAPVRIAMTPGGRRGQRQRPSGLEGNAVTWVGEHLRLERSAPLQRGALLHAWLEQIEWLDEHLPERFPAPAGVDVEQERAYFARILAQPMVRQTLSRKTYELPGTTLRVYRELPFAQRQGDDILSGKLDRVVVARSAEQTQVTVIDFKTDMVTDDGDIATRTAYYAPQIQAYRLAAARVFRVPPERVSGQLLFLHADRLERV